MDIVKRSIIFVFSGAILAYIGYLFQQGTVIIQPDVNPQWNIIAYASIMIIFLYLIIFYAIKPMYFKRAKILNTILGLVLIVIWHNLLTNDVASKLYVGDIITVIGSLLTIIGYTNILILKKIKQQKEESEMEIIEV